MKYRDCKKRKALDYGHEPSFLYLRRFRCETCNKLHTEIPSTICPRKHYKKEIINDVICGYTVEDDPIAEDGPANITMKRWIDLYKGGKLDV
jgi:hypothetical protein